MSDQDADRDSIPSHAVTNPHQFREALARVRVLEDAPANSLRGQERVTLELAISRYLATQDDAQR
ncbi:MAG TPA: hypothetical protein VGO06_08515 [Bosea sp. (in: a-proteobacteria)]|jgi:hypothetical protein|uniref:hypothetical protein n=1 Tax=Bosea sp. (in: a-proteobacteria) TaxID=1871050 RepID=UPI002E166A4F|nr:hypothetical protein [Bosea sp. (in: a-proteobacteria)]